MSTRDRAQLDPALVWATLSPAEQAVVLGFLSTLGFEPNDWADLPGFRGLLELVAVVRVSVAYADEPNSALQLVLASEDLGMPDDGTRRAHPGERFVQRLYDWQSRVRKSQSGEADEGVDSPRTTTKRRKEA